VLGTQAPHQQGHQDGQGRWTGFDIDFCRALAAAVVGSPDRVVFVPLSNDMRLAALKAARMAIVRLARLMVGPWR
jgi:ABC-type amino acid transport substrate-binding protein